MRTIQLICSCILLAWNVYASDSYIGKTCKNEQGTCQPKGSCPDHKIGHCCGKYDCCEEVCTHETSDCESGQGTCVSDRSCGTIIEGNSECCDGLTCCEKCKDETSDCESGQGTCVSDDSCGSIIEGNSECCDGLTCCGKCKDFFETCTGIGSQTGVCATCDGFTNFGQADCCSGYLCCEP